MKRFTEDLRYAVRLLYRSPGFTTVAVMTLALAIGATSTIFSAVNAVLIRESPYPDPSRRVLLWGDGSCAYTLGEFDTYVRHGVAPIAIIGNDASWGQIAREQVEILGTTLGCDLRRSYYHKVAEGYGGVGMVLSDPARVDATLAEAKSIARGGRPVCINVMLRKSDFRKGSISM